MRIHLSCRTCLGPVWDCRGVVYNFKLIIANLEDTQHYCPFCFWEFKLGKKHELDELISSLHVNGHDLCASCHLACGTNPIPPAVDVTPYLTSFPGLDFGWRGVATPPEVLHFWDSWDELWARDVRLVTQGAATNATFRVPPRRGGISLKQGQLRCTCNKCARLEVRLEGAGE